ncbi:hypothetical protein BH11PLA1_BH11PLA1_16690 [soil metagenome]
MLTSVAVYGYVIAFTTLSTPRWISSTRFGFKGDSVCWTVGEYSTPYTNALTGRNPEFAFSFSGPNYLDVTIMSRNPEQGNYFSVLRPDVNDAGVLYAHALLCRENLNPGCNIAVINFPSFCPVIASGFMSRPDPYGNEYFDGGWKLKGFRLRLWGSLFIFAGGMMSAIFAQFGWRALTGSPEPGYINQCLNWLRDTPMCSHCGYSRKGVNGFCPECGHTRSFMG